MNYSGYKNVHPNGKVINHHKPVIDPYGKQVSSDHIQSGVVQPPYAQTDTNGGLGYDDDDVDYSYEPLPMEIKVIIGIVAVPAILHRLFEAFTPLMQSLLVPSLIMVLALTFFLPNARKALARQNSEDKKYQFNIKKYRLVRNINLFFSFIVTYPLVSPILYSWTESIADLFEDNTSFLVSVFGVILMIILYFVRFAIAMFLIPFIQKLAWKFAPNIFVNSITQKFMKRTKNNS